MIKTLLSELISFSNDEQREAAKRYIEENNLSGDALFSEIKTLLEEHDPNELF